MQTQPSPQCPIDSEWNRLQLAISDPDRALEDMNAALELANQAIQTYLRLKDHTKSEELPNYMAGAHLLNSLDVLFRQW